MLCHLCYKWLWQVTWIQQVNDLHSALTSWGQLLGNHKQKSLSSLNQYGGVSYSRGTLNTSVSTIQIPIWVTQLSPLNLTKKITSALVLHSPTGLMDLRGKCNVLFCWQVQPLSLLEKWKVKNPPTSCPAHQDIIFLTRHLFLTMFETEFWEVFDCPVSWKDTEETPFFQTR